MDVADRMCVIVPDPEAARRDEKSDVARGSLRNIGKMCRVQEACKNNAARASKSQKIKKCGRKGKVGRRPREQQNLRTNSSRNSSWRRCRARSPPDVHLATHKACTEPPRCRKAGALLTSAASVSEHESFAGKRGARAPSFTSIKCNAPPREKQAHRHPARAAWLAGERRMYARPVRTAEARRR